MSNETTDSKFNYNTDAKKGPLDCVILDTKGAVIKFAGGKNNARAKNHKTVDITILGSIERNEIEILLTDSNMMLIVSLNDLSEILAEAHKVSNNIAMSEGRS
jgi:hypothetical protein